jgi:uncharacterized membrane protein YfcA
MITNKLFHIYYDFWPVPLIMILGSFVAGASAEGGGAIAFPFFTLLLNIEPATARNFVFAIQSIGMTSASLLIIGKKILIEKNVILYGSIGSLIGLTLGSFFILDIMPHKETKLFFVSFWLSFALVLAFTTFRVSKCVYTNINLDHIQDRLYLLIFGVIGGLITSLFGNGVDIITFCLVTLRFNLCEKVATPTSVILMTVSTVFGFLLHLLIIKDFKNEEFTYWLSAIPVVVIFAPLGAYVIKFFSRELVAVFLISVIIIQFVGGVFILKPLSISQLTMSLTTIVLGSLFFITMYKKS